MEQIILEGIILIVFGGSEHTQAQVLMLYNIVWHWTCGISSWGRGQLPPGLPTNYWHENDKLPKYTRRQDSRQARENDRQRISSGGKPSADDLPARALS